MCLMEESYKLMQKKNQIFKILRAPSIWNQGVCLWQCTFLNRYIYNTKFNWFPIIISLYSFKWIIQVVRFAKKLRLWTWKKNLIFIVLICDTIKGDESYVGNIQFWYFKYKPLVNLKCYILIQIPSQLDIWLQRYERFFKFKNNVKHKNLSPLLACNSKSIFPTSDSFPLIMSHMI